jgi:hypothetical protein
MERPSLELPDVSLHRSDRLRFFIVAFFVAFAVLRVVPDAIRTIYPLNVFGYATDGAGVVTWVSHDRPRAKGDRLAVGDRIRVDAIKAFDRKPGIVGIGYSRDNPDRTLTIVRGDRERLVHLASRPEPLASRILAAVRVLVFLACLGLAAMLFLVRPSLATGAIFFYALGAQAPTTFSEVVLDNPWQQLPIAFADLLHGAARPALLLFAICLATTHRRMTRLAAAGCIAAAIVLGSLDAFANWRATYAGYPLCALSDLYVHASSLLTALAIAAFAFAIVRAHGKQRARLGWIAGTFALAGIARVITENASPDLVSPLVDGLLSAAAVLPIVVVWVYVVRQRFFNVDFVVSRAIVYVALTGAVVGTITLAEEIGTYVFYQNTDLAYGFLIVISTLVGMATGKIQHLIEKIVDHFVFRDRRDRRAALELISGYVLDAEHPGDVYRAILDDTAHALSLHFAGVLLRTNDERFVKDPDCRWPEDFEIELSAHDPIVRTVARTRSALQLTGHKRHRLPGAAHERLSVVAPLFSHRKLVALVVYGRNISGLNLNADERERLSRTIAHASLAFASIELARAREALVSDSLVTVEPGTPERI